jgi:hypothetical protein
MKAQWFNRYTRLSFRAGISGSLPNAPDDNRGTHHGRQRSSLMDAAVSKQEDYRAHALECLHEAQFANDRESKNVLKRLAVLWIVLAHEAERAPPTMPRTTGLLVG